MYLSVRKVPAHLPHSAVLDGRISYADWKGNQIADKEARKGAELHTPIDDLVQEANELSRYQLNVCTHIATINKMVNDKGWHSFGQMTRTWKTRNLLAPGNHP